MIKKRPKLIIVKSLKEIPSRFDSEDDEREWWATHELSTSLYDQLEDMTEELDRIAPLPEGPKSSKLRTRVYKLPSQDSRHS
jgi:hypothetical protein